VRSAAPDVAAVGEFAVTGITVGLQDTLEALQVGDGSLGFAIGRIDMGNTRWIRPGSIRFLKRGCKLLRVMMSVLRPKMPAARSLTSINSNKPSLPFS
jgi:hypothetical protein